jgi:hypothetical protein
MFAGIYLAVKEIKGLREAIISSNRNWSHLDLIIINYRAVSMAK